MRVYIMTDLEGVSGVTLFDQTRDEGPAYENARHLLMGDVNAALQGCFEGGATQVVVADGHGHPLNFLPEEMHPRGEFICGRGFPDHWGQDTGFEAAMLVGSHAMNRTPDGVLYHTQSSRSDARYWYNDRECGEIAQDAMVLGHFDIPVVMVTGDAAACREARHFLGEHVVTVAVKQGYGRQCCRMIPPARAQEMIREGAKEAMGRLGLCRPFKMALPMRGRLEVLAAALPDTATPEEVAAAPHQVMEKVFADQLHIYSFS
jgi:D-amino peptidase